MHHCTPYRLSTARCPRPLVRTPWFDHPDAGNTHPLALLCPIRVNTRANHDLHPVQTRPSNPHGVTGDAPDLQRVLVTRHRDAPTCLPDALEIGAVASDVVRTRRDSSLPFRLLSPHHSVLSPALISIHFHGAENARHHAPNCGDSASAARARPTKVAVLHCRFSVADKLWLEFICHCCATQKMSPHLARLGVPVPRSSASARRLQHSRISCRPPLHRSTRHRKSNAVSTRKRNLPLVEASRCRRRWES